MTNKKHIAQRWYVFDGQNTTTGNPNSRTGLHSIYGQLFAYSSKKEAMNYVEEAGGRFQGQICVAGGKRTMRKFFLGLSTKQFERYLDILVSDL